MAAVSDLVSLLDGQISGVQAAALLQEANGCIETAVAQFFAANEGGGAGPSDNPDAKLQLLKGMLPGTPDEVLMKHLSDAKGSVERAADAFFGRAADVEPKQSEEASESAPLEAGPSRSRRRVRSVNHLYAGPSTDEAGPSGGIPEDDIITRPKRRFPFTAPKVTKVEQLPMKKAQAPLLTLGVNGPADSLKVRRGDGQEYALPLAAFRSEQGGLFAPYGTELLDKVEPSKALDFSFPGVHLGAFCIALDSNAAKAINKNSGFVEVAWEGVGLVLIDGDGNPDGAYQKREWDDTMTVSLGEGWKQGGGFVESVEVAVHAAHREGLVRLFATLDNCGRDLGGRKKGATKCQPNEALVKFAAFSQKHHQLSRGAAVFLHVCLTEKACRYNYEDGGFGNLKNGKRQMKSERHLLKLARALQQSGLGLEPGPDSDEFLNHGSDGQDHEPISEQNFDLFNLLASIDLPESAPLAATPPQLLTQPMRYQLKGLSWMMTREGGESAVSRNILTLHPCWEQLLCADGQIIYMQREDGSCSQNFYTAPHQGTCGGLLCDEMGLGKTLEMLMLVLAHPPPPGWAVTDKLAWDGSEQVMPIKATLVIVPASLLDQWKREIELHVRPGALKVLHYEGRHRKTAGAGKRAAVDWELEQYDVIITSYEVIRAELAGSADSPLLTYGFWRVVVDEAQLVANSSSVAAVTASSIMRRHAWVVTGTPITSRLDELQGLLDFLAVQPFGEPAVFRSLLKAPYEARSAVGLQRLRVLLKAIMIRRTKTGVANEMVLPPCTKQDVLLAFSDVEASYYQRVHESFVAAIKRMDRFQATRDQRRLDGFDPSNLGARVSGSALANLTRLRQACCHPQIIRAGNEFLGKARLTMPQIMAKLVERARAAHDGAARDWLVAQLALAVATATEGRERAPTLFEPLLAQITKCGGLAYERSGLIKAPFDGDIESERSSRQTATRTNYWKLELVALKAYREFLEKDMADGDDSEGREETVAKRKVELEDSLGITAERLALSEAGRKLTRAEQKKQDEALRLAQERKRAEAGEGSSAASPSTLAAEADQGRMTRHGKRKLEAAFGNSDDHRTNSDPTDVGKEVDAILEGPWVARKGKKARTPEQRISAAQSAVHKAKDKMEELFRQEKHLDFKLDEIEKGKGKVDDSSTSDGLDVLPTDLLGAQQTVIQEDKTQCPICLDSCEDNGAVTMCGHYFCSDCIHEYIQSKGADAPCPLCRHKLKTKDVFNACKEPERRQGDLPDMSGEYGTKISALISELIGIRSKDPTAKSVIFSSWRLLLNLAGEALAQNGFRFSFLWGRPEERVQALKDFNENPEVRAILVLMGNSGGAAGLTLTAASTAFILEPSVNPGMEAQAAARIHRLSQDRPTRVVRFIVDKTIEPKIVQLQSKKLEMGGSSGGGMIVMEQLRGQDLLELIEEDVKGKQQVTE